MLKKSSRIIVPQDHCLIIQSSIAKKLGRTNALFLQQLHYKITSGDSVGVIFEGKRWVYNTYQDWVDHIKTISKSTIKRSIAFLKFKGIIACRALSKNKAMRVNYYTINYDRLNEILGLTEGKDLAPSIPIEIQRESIINSSFPHRVKMTSSSGQNDPMLYTEITSDIKINISEQKISQKILPNDKANKSKQVKEIKENYLAKLLLDAWFQIVEQGKGELHLSKKRAQFLVAAFNLKFDKSMEKWKKYCQDISSSRFLMGEIKSSFRATLDWALKFDVIQKILEGNYGIGDRRPSTVPSAAESFLKNSKIELHSEEEAIQQTTDESELVREFRLKWLNKFGASTYRECLKDCAIEVGDDATLILRPSSRYNAKSISSYWTPTLLVASPFTKAHVVQHEGDLVFDKWFLLEPGREGTLPEHEGLGVKASSDVTAEPMAMSLPEVTNIVAAVIEKPSVEPLPCEAKESGVVVTQVTSETRMLRKKLRESMPHNQFPTWLGSIEVEEVARDGSVIVTFDDSFAVGWSRSRFSKEIFQSAASLWKGVNKLIIRQKVGDTIPLPVETSPKISEHVEEKSALEQAIQSFLSVCSPGRKAAGTLGTQEACHAFG